MASFSIPILAKMSHFLSVPIPCANFQPIPLTSKQTRDKWGAATKSDRGSGMLSNLLSCSVVSVSLWPLGSNRAPLPMKLSQKEYWSRLPFLAPGDLPEPEMETVSPALAGGSCTTSTAGKPQPGVHPPLYPRILNDRATYIIQWLWSRISPFE